MQLMALSINVHQASNIFTRLYSKIDGPRKSDTLFQFGIYLFSTIAGLVAFLGLSTLLIKQVGPLPVFIFGAFGLIGGLLTMIAVLPGIHWLERTGAILILTSVLIYDILLISANNGVPISPFFVSALAIGIIRRITHLK